MAVSDPSPDPQIISSNRLNVRAQNRCIWKVDEVKARVQRISIDGQSDVKSGLLKSEAQTANPAEEIDGDGRIVQRRTREKNGT